MGYAERRAQGPESGSFQAGAVGAAELGIARTGLPLVKGKEVVEGVEMGKSDPVASLGMGAAQVDDMRGGSAGALRAGPEHAESFGVGRGIEGNAEDDGLRVLPCGFGVGRVHYRDGVAGMAMAPKGFGKRLGSAQVAIED